MNRKGGTHLSKQDRNAIRDGLAINLTLKEIATSLDKDERTISKEIKKRRNKTENGRAVLRNKPIEECKKITRFPYVCNGCSKRNSCLQDFKWFYDPDLAQENYEIILSTSREGIDMSFEDKVKLDAILKNGIDKGQSPYHIVKSNPENIKCSVRTVYRYIDQNKTVVQNIDLRRKVKLKPRTHYKEKNKGNLQVFEGRSYVDFIRFYAEHPGIGLTEIDTVEGQKEGKNKCLLTIHSTALHFMMIILLESKTKECVSRAFLHLQKLLGKLLYKKLFCCTLTDRGSEFVDPSAIENFCEDGEKICHLFYCDSYSSYQKGAIEENHVLIRYVIPKGTSLNDFSQDDMNLLMSHINSYHRASISSSPIILAKALYGEEFLKKIKVDEINPNDITLKPTLLK